MHPVNYDITVKTMQLELERSQRKKPSYEVMAHANEARSAGPRRIDTLIARLAAFCSPARIRRAFAD